MGELEMLMEQKREIEAKIRAIKNQSAKYGIVKIDVEHYPTHKPDRHFLAIKYQPLDDGRPKYQTIYSSNDRQSVIEAIPHIIDNLQKLYDSVKGGSI